MAQPEPGSHCDVRCVPPAYGSGVLLTVMLTPTVRAVWASTEGLDRSGCGSPTCRCRSHGSAEARRACLYRVRHFDAGRSGGSGETLVVAEEGSQPISQAGGGREMNGVE